MSLQTADAAMIDDLVQHIGEGAISTDPNVLQSHSHDFGKIVDHQVPLAVVFADRVEDVQAALRIASAAGVSVVPRGAGTGV